MPRRKNPIINFRLVKYRGKYHVSYTRPENGKTYRKSTGTADLKVAETCMPAIVSELRAELDGIATPSKTYSLGDLLDAYAAHRGNKKDSTFYALKPLRKFFSGFKPTQLNDAAWSDYRQWRAGIQNGSAAFKGDNKTVSDATACRELHTIRTAINWAGRNGWKGLENIKVHIPDEPHNACQEHLSKKEVISLVKACVEPHQRLFVHLAIATGARMSALLEMTWDDVKWPGGGKGPLDDSDALLATNIINEDDDVFEHPETGEVYIRHGHDFDVEMAETLQINLGVGRGNKRRGTGIIGRANMALYEELTAAYKRRKTNFVIEYRGKPLKKINLAKAYERAGLIHYARRQHLLKHTCCSWLVQSGAPFEAVGKLIGTRANVIEAHYGHLSPEHLETISDVLNIR